MQRAPYSPNPASVKRFFTTIQTIGKPEKVNAKFLPTVGFKSGNDRYIPGILKFLGFLDSSGAPTDQWMAYKDRSKAKQVLAAAIRSSYDELFTTLPDAHNRESSAIQDFFAGKWGTSATMASLMEKTFRVLVELADFSTVPSTPPSRKDEAAIKDTRDVEVLGTKPITINVNIQLQLPATEDATIYESLFAALKKNILS